MTQKSKFYEHVHTVSHKMVQCTVQFLAKRGRQTDRPSNCGEYTVAAIDNQPFPFHLNTLQVYYSNMNINNHISL